MAQETGYTFSEFLRERVATPEEWQEWESVRDAPPPVTTTRPAPPTSARILLHDTEPASPAFLRKQELNNQFREGLRAELLTGEWEVSGRTGAPVTRQKLENVDIERAVIDFIAGQVGPLGDLRVRRGAAESNVEVIKRFIELVCRVVAQPRKKITKRVIDDLAQALRAENYSIPAFQAAWEEAAIHPDWRKPGP